MTVRLKTNGDLARPPLVGDGAAEHVQQAAHAHDPAACLCAPTAANALRIGDHFHLHNSSCLRHPHQSPIIHSPIIRLSFDMRHT